ncbi:MAG TPA: PAS domain S-box protein [Melioribacteraceae bacterium]|nr:PAS domain S-box protein [Melioribacteraceae bacterium]
MNANNTTEIDLDTKTIQKIVDCYEEQIALLKSKVNAFENENIQLNAILLSTNSGTWVWDLVEDSLTVNNRYIEMMGYERGELLITKPIDCKNLIHPDDLIKINYEIESHLLGKKELLECEFRMKHKLGDWIWVLSKGKIIKRNEEGKPIQMAGMHIDITATKNLKEKYDANLELWHSAFDYHTSVMLLIEPIRGNIIDANYSASKFYGYSIDELKTKKISEINILSKDQIEQERIKAFNSERNYFIFPHKLASGEIRTVEVNSSVVYIENQKLLFSIIHDITDRKLAEDKLKLSEEKYRTILKTALEGFFIIEENGKIIEVNESYAKISGYDIKELKKMNVLDLTAEYDKISFNKKIKLIKENQSLRYETLHKKKDGKVIEVEISAKYQNINNADIFIIFIRDISEMKKASNKILNMKENYERFLNSLDELLFVFSESGNILFVNNEVLKRLEYSPIDLINHNIIKYYNIELSKLNSLGIENLGKNSLSNYIHTKNNTKIPIEARILKGIWDDKPAYFGLFKDISQIIISEEKFSKVFKLNPVACAIFEPETGIYLEVNDAYCKLFEYEEKDIIGKNAIDLKIIDIDTKEEILKIRDLEGKIYNYETKFYTKSGKTKYVILSIDNIQIFDKIVRFSVAADITDLKETHNRLTNINQQLIASKNIIEKILIEKEIVINQLNETKNRLEKINSEKDKLFSIIAHDLKSPFQGFLGLTELLANDFNSITGEEMQELFGQFNDSTKRLYNLLSNLLDWSRVQRGMITFEPKIVDLSSVIKQNISVLSQSIKNKNIIIKNNIQYNFMVFVDEKMINSVIRNLLSNAVKFSMINSEVVISILNFDETFVTVAIKDEGIGIPEEVFSKLFIIGEKVGRKGTLGEESTGLGLLLCKEFIELHNGKIWVESEIEKGSKFYFSLPIKDIFS